MFSLLIRLFCSMDFLMVNKNRIMAEGFPILSAPVIVLPILKGLSSFSVSMWLPITVKSILLEKA